MLGFSIKTRQNVTAGSPTAVGSGGEVGEIDTSAPFRSVKAAVSLFGVVASPKEPTHAPPHLVIKKSPKTSQDERVLEKETSHLHLTCKEADKFKQQLEVAENEKIQALGEHEKANRTLQELKIKLKNFSESKQAALQSTEAAKARVKQLEESRSPAQLLNDAARWEQEEVDSKIQQHKISVEELNSAKQELTNLRQDFESAMEAKLAAFQNAADAKHDAKVNRDKLTTLSKEIGIVRSTLAQVKLASSQAQDGHSRIMAEKDARLESKRSAKEGVEKRIWSLKELEYDVVDPEVAGKLQEMLEETNEAILVLQEQLNTVRAFDLDSLRVVTMQVDDAKETLQQVLKEKSWLGSFVELLKLELEKVRRDKKELTEKVTETALLSEKLQVELVNNKEEREAALTGENKQGDSTSSRIQVLSLEAADATKEAEELNRKVETLKQEAEGFRAIAKLAEEKLMVAVEDTEEAKTRKEVANSKLFRQNSSSSNICGGGGELIRMTDNKCYCSSSSSKSAGKIRLTAEEFETLKAKAEKAGNSAEREVANAMAQVEAVNGREKEARERLDVISKEMEDIKAATHHSLKQADVAEAAKRAVETELLCNRILLTQQPKPPANQQLGDHPTYSSSSSSSFI